ncbi:MAG: hypothetical protein KAW12_10315 [Candidatus Aminicenantes bacterium]|nr:hypothetical protein [Candidatus Aminicenantes bacterium]
MPFVTLPAHFDGERICLDETFDLEPDAKLMVTILPKKENSNEHENWLSLSGRKLEQAYSEDEDEYAPSLLKEVNPNYEAG